VKLLVGSWMFLAAWVGYVELQLPLDPDYAGLIALILNGR